MAENESAPQSATIIRKSLLSASVAGGKCVTRVEVKQIDLQPGQRTGYHLHAIPVVGFIARGSIRFQIEGGPVQILPQEARSSSQPTPGSGTSTTRPIKSQRLSSPITS